MLVETRAQVAPTRRGSHTPTPTPGRSSIEERGAGFSSVVGAMLCALGSGVAVRTQGVRFGRIAGSRLVATSHGGPLHRAAPELRGPPREGAAASPRPAPALPERKLWKAHRSPRLHRTDRGWTWPSRVHFLGLVDFHTKVGLGGRALAEQPIGGRRSDVASSLLLGSEGVGSDMASGGPCRGSLRRLVARCSQLPKARVRRGPGGREGWRGGRGARDGTPSRRELAPPRGPAATPCLAPYRATADGAPPRPPRVRLPPRMPSPWMLGDLAEGHGGAVHGDRRPRRLRAVPARL